MVSTDGLSGLSLEELEFLRGELVPAREEMRRVRKNSVCKKIENSNNDTRIENSLNDERDQSVDDSGNTDVDDSNNNTDNSVHDNTDNSVEQDGLVNINELLYLDDLEIEIL